MTRTRTVIVIVLCLLSSVLAPRPALTFAAPDDAQERWGRQFAYGVASPILSVVHVPLKAALCGTTAVLSGLAYLVTFGSPSVTRDAADAVKAACAGPYIITPQRLWRQGEGDGRTGDASWQ